MKCQLIYQKKAYKTFKSMKAAIRWLDNNWAKFMEAADDTRDYGKHMERAAHAWYGWRILKI